MIDLSFPVVELEYFLLIFTRVTCFIFVAPFYSMNNTPQRVRVGLGFFISVLLYYMLIPHETIVYETVLQYAFIILKEAITGLLIGLSANICMTIVGFAGHVVDMEIGLSMMSQFDPTTKENLSITGQYYQNMMMLMLIISGMHRYLLSAFAETYSLIRINGMIINGPRMMSAVLAFMRDYLLLGFQICLPVFIAATLMNCVLGILAKIAPQMNMFSVGIQLKIMVGLLVLLLTVEMLPRMTDMVYIQIKRTIVAFIGGMS